MRTYVKITAEEMVEFLAQFGLIETKPVSGERIFIREYDNGKALMVYSSLPVSGGSVRERGEDAVRIVARNNKTGNHRKVGKVLRIGSWRQNLHIKIQEARVNYHLYDIPRCIECGSPEVNGTTPEGDDVCAYHQLVVPGKQTVLHEEFGYEPAPISCRVLAWGM